MAGSRLADKQVQYFALAVQYSPFGLRLVQAERLEVGGLFDNQLVGPQAGNQFEQFLKVCCLGVGADRLGHFPVAVNPGEGDVAGAVLDKGPVGVVETGDGAIAELDRLGDEGFGHRGG